MKTAVRSIMVCLALAVSLVAVQAVYAGTCSVTVSGEITAIVDYDNAIVIDEVTVYGIPLSYLAKKLNVVPAVGDYAVVTADQCPRTGRLTACTLSLNNSAAINLPGTRSSRR